MLEKLDFKKVLIVGGILFSIIIVTVIAINISSGTPSQSSSGTAIDLAFDNWVISGEGYNRYIEDKGDYIEIFDHRYGKYIQAQLDVDSIVHGAFKFQVQTPDLSKSGSFQFLFNSGGAWIFNIIKLKNSATWYFRCYGGGFISLIAKDTNWHNIEFEFELNGDNSVVSLKVDGVIKIDSMMFSTTQLGINNIKYTSSSVYIPSLTRIKLESLNKI